MTEPTIESTLKRLSDELSETNRRIRKISSTSKLIKLILTVKEPDAVRAAEAYDGLRKQVVSSASDRRAHLNHLAEIAIAVRRGSSIEDIAKRCGEWLAQADVRVVQSASTSQELSDWFETTSEEVDSSPHFLEPAYLDGRTGAVIKRGRARLPKLTSVASQTAQDGSLTTISQEEVN
jgi:hypothetical protein